jgi:N,N'-diacetyllegionaminate synthase
MIANATTPRQGGSLPLLDSHIELAGRTVGVGNPCFLVFEAGPTHDSLASAKRLIKLAADAGADAVKFQMVDPDRLVADRKQLFSYDVLLDRESGRTETVSEPLYDILKRRTLTMEEWRELKAYSDSLRLAFFVTVAFEEDIRFVEEAGCHSLKIASADVTHLPLIRRAARTGVAIQLDTGNSTLGEIETAVDAILAEGNRKIIIHQCPSGYPARRESINLNIIPTLRQMFGCPVAYSDHTPGWDMDIAALVIGANLIEKTITENRATRSVEHIMSLEPPMLDAFVSAIRDVEVALGQPRRILLPAERQKSTAVRRSVFLRDGVKAGTRLADAPIDFRRPGFGLAPDRYETMGDHVFRQDRDAGHMVTFDDLVARAG